MRSEARNLILAALMATLTFIGAQIRVQLFAVPFTLQTLFVLLAGGILGPFWGAASMALYLFMGLVGLPVFAGGAGPGVILSPTFGYLLGFPLAAYWAGRSVPLSELSGAGLARIFFALLIALGWVYVLGVAYLWLIKNLYFGEELALSRAIWIGFAVFVPVALLKAFLAALLLRYLSPRIRCGSV